MITTTHEIRCESCGASLTVDAHIRATRCPYCDSPQVVDRPATVDRPDPTYVLGFEIDRDSAMKSVAGWIRSRGVFVDPRFKRSAPDKTEGVYLPAYLYAATSHSDYEASIGEDYTITETYTTTDSKGNTTIHTRTRTVTEWRPLSGRHATYVLDVLVTASKGISNLELETVEPYDLRALRRYEPAVVSGFLAEDPTLPPENCRRLARGEAEVNLRRDIEAFLPGDHQQGLELTTELKDEVLDLVLLPLWVFAVRYEGREKPVRILVNGQTGEIQGKVPLSGLRIALAVAISLAVVGAIVLFFVIRGS